MASCGSYYRVVTTVEPDGSLRRDIYTRADSAFLAGDVSHNPYLFGIDGWQVSAVEDAERTDFFGDREDVNVKITRWADDIGDFTANLAFDRRYASFVEPEESFRKSRGLFYTTYEYSARYRKLDFEFAVPVERFMTEDEQRLWFKGGLERFEGMSGAEAYNELSEIEGKYLEMINRNMFEFALRSMEGFISGRDIAEADRAEIYKLMPGDAIPLDIDPEAVSKLLDEFYRTDYFSGVYRINADGIDDLFGEYTWVLEVVGTRISYQLILPGGYHSKGEFDGTYLLFYDYTITVVCQVEIWWRLALGGAFVLAAIGWGVAAIVKRRRRA